jgi:hypothetical protein
MRLATVAVVEPKVVIVPDGAVRLWTVAVLTVRTLAPMLAIEAPVAFRVVTDATLIVATFDVRAVIVPFDDVSVLTVPVFAARVAIVAVVDPRVVTVPLTAVSVLTEAVLTVKTFAPRLVIEPLVDVRVVNVPFVIVA